MKLITHPEKFYMTGYTQKYTCNHGLPRNKAIIFDIHTKEKSHFTNALRHIYRIRK